MIRKITRCFLLALPFFLFKPTNSFAQDPGAWYMYFLNLRPSQQPFSWHAEVQYRNHNLIGDLEQLLLRTGLQYNTPDNDATFTLGYGHIVTESEGEVNNSFFENRIYQEGLLKQKVGIVKIDHRFRYEQRFIQDQDFRTRFRYAIFVNIPFNRKSLSKGTIYASVYNEIFINGEKKPGVELFDRDRIYGALGYQLADNVGLRLGYMSQVLNRRTKGQLQLSVHHQIR